jgi:hypothetical protein
MRCRVPGLVPLLAATGRAPELKVLNPISKFVTLAALGLLVIIFGFILFALAVPLLVRLFIPGTGAFAFSLSRNAFTIALVAVLTVVVAALCFFIRAFRRRHQN